MFGVGGILGVVCTSRLISWLFKTQKSYTLHFLVGLVMGSLLFPLSLMFKAATMPLWIVLLSFFAGIGIVFGIERVVHQN